MSSIFSVFTSASTSTRSPHQQNRPSQPLASTTTATATTNPSSPPSSSSTNNNATTQQQRTAEARAAFDASLAATGQSLNHELHARATNIHENARKLDGQDGDVRRQTEVLRREVDGLEREVARARGVIGGVADEGAGEYGDQGRGGGGMADEFEEEMRRIEAELDGLDGMLDEVEGLRSDEEEYEAEQGREEVAGSVEESIVKNAVGVEASRPSGGNQIAADHIKAQESMPAKSDQHIHAEEGRK